MRRLLIILFLVSPTAHAGVAFVQGFQSSSSGAGSSLTVATDATTDSAGNALGVCVRQSNDDTPPTVANLGMDTFTQIGTTDISTGDAVTLFYAKNITGHVSDIVTATWLSAETYRWIGVIELSGADTAAPLDAHPTPNHANDNADQTITSNTFSTVVASEISLACSGWGDISQTFVAGTEDGGYTIPSTAPDGDAAFEYNVFSGTKSGTTASMSAQFHPRAIVVGTLAATAGPPPSGTRLRGQVIQ